MQIAFAKYLSLLCISFAMPFCHSLTSNGKWSMYIKIVIIRRFTNRHNEHKKQKKKNNKKIRIEKHEKLKIRITFNFKCGR